MGVASLTLDLYPSHTVTVVLFFCYVVHLVAASTISLLQFSRVAEARPTAARLKLVLGSKKRNFATDAYVRSFAGVLVDPGAREGPLRPFLPRDVVLGRRQDDPPLVLSHLARPFLGL